MTRTRKQEAERQEAIESLRDLLKPGDTVYTVLRHVSSSGMNRMIDCYVIRDNEPRWISRMVAKAVDYPFDEKKEAIRVGGCGMDMGFAVVYNLGRVLFPEGFQLAKGQHGRNGDTSGYDDDGGYALHQRWM